MVSGLGGTKPSSLSPFLFHQYKVAECLEQDKERYLKATRVAEAYDFKDSEESTDEDTKGSEAGEVGPSEPAPPVEVTPKSAKTKRKTTPKSTGGTRKKRISAKGKEDGFNLCEQSMKDIKGMATLMTGQLALAKEGYEYLLDIFHQALQVADGIKEDELVAFIQQRVQFGNNKKLEDRIRVLERELETERTMNGSISRHSSSPRRPPSTLAPGKQGGDGCNKGVFLRGEYERSVGGGQPIQGRAASYQGLHLHQTLEVCPGSHKLPV
jgi:hypothetical protein